VRHPIFPLLALCGLLLTSSVRAEENASPISAPVDLPAERSTKTEAAAALSLSDSLILGVVEGITEFLPVSSTGHLIITNHMLGLESRAPLQDDQGNILWHKPPTPEKPAGEPVTIKLAADTYAVVIQAGAIIAVVFIYWGQLMSVLRGLTGRDAAGLRLLRNIVLACVPAGILGLIFGDWIDEHLFSIPAVIIALIGGAILMFAAERWRKRAQGLNPPRIAPADLTAKQAFGIGVMQCLALWPGTSRSMVTMVGGYFAGLSPARAAEFSFLVGLPTLSGAALYKGIKAGPTMIDVFGWPHVLAGTFAAAISSALAVKFLVSYLGRHGLGVFAIYRVVLAGVLALLVFQNILS
jgi:Uncharacterized bacitracin resistance protein